MGPGKGHRAIPFSSQSMRATGYYFILCLTIKVKGSAQLDNGEATVKGSIEDGRRPVFSNRKLNGERRPLAGSPFSPYVAVVLLDNAVGY